MWDYTARSFTLWCRPSKESGAVLEGAYWRAIGSLSQWSVSRFPHLFCVIRGPLRDFLIYVLKAISKLEC